MWYFAWILGLGLAVAFGVLNGLWHEFRLFDEGDHGMSEPDPVQTDPIVAKAGGADPS